MLLLSLLVGRVTLEFLQRDDQKAQTAAPATGSAVVGESADIAAVQALNLFSAEREQSVNGQQQAAFTNSGLDLRLEGVMVATKTADSRAVIVSGGQQDSYRIGDTVPTGGTVELLDIAVDHVTLDNNGLEIQLPLYDSTRQPAQTAASNSLQVAPARVAAQAATRQTDARWFGEPAQGGELQLDVQGSGFNSIEQLRTGLQAAGLQVELIGSTSEGAQSRARLKVLP